MWASFDVAAAATAPAPATTDADADAIGKVRDVRYELSQYFRVANVELPLHLICFALIWLDLLYIFDGVLVCPCLSAI